MNGRAPEPPLPAFAAATLWIVDLDGVVWLTGEPIGSVGEAVAELRSHGIRVVFATNNSAPTTDELLARLGRIGIESAADDLATSAAAVASLLVPGQRVGVLAEAGVHESLAARGVEVVEPDAVGTAEAAVVGWSRSFDFEMLAAASHRRSGVGPADRNERGSHPSDAQWTRSGVWGVAGRGGHGVRRHAGDRREAPSGHGQTDAGAVRFH